MPPKDKTKIIGMTHLNGNVLCAVAIETTGDKLFYHDVCQIAIIPVDYEINILKTIIPFHCDIKPRYENRIDLDKMTITRERMQDICKHGLDSLAAAELLENWFAKLPIYHTKRIMPMCYNWPRTYAFLCNWLTQTSAEYFFDYRYRDLLPISLWLNDYNDYKINNVPFAKNDFPYICSSFNIQRDHGSNRDSLSDARAMIDLYKSTMNNIDILELYRSDLYNQST